MESPRYLFICEHCSNKLFFSKYSEIENLIKVEKPSIQKTIHKKEQVKQKPKYKCPKCGYLFKLISNEDQKPNP